MRSLGPVTRRSLAVLAAAIGALGQAGAAPASESRTLLRLSIASDATYALDGKPVAREGLLAAFKAGSAGRVFDLEITASTRTPYDVIAVAITRANEAGVGGVKLRQQEVSPAASSPSAPGR